MYPIPCHTSPTISGASILHYKKEILSLSLMAHKKEGKETSSINFRLSFIENMFDLNIISITTVITF